MPLHDSFNRSGAQQNMRLSNMSSVPTVDDLNFALAQAIKNPRNIIELPWKSATSPVSYIIKVTCGLSIEEPRWILHVGGDGEDAVLWSYDTPDTTLINSLITAECDRGTYTTRGHEDIPPEVQAASASGWPEAVAVPQPAYSQPQGQNPIQNQPQSRPSPPEWPAEMGAQGSFSATWPSALPPGSAAEPGPSSRPNQANPHQIAPPPPQPTPPSISSVLDAAFAPAQSQALPRAQSPGQWSGPPQAAGAGQPQGSAAPQSPASSQPSAQAAAPHVQQPANSQAQPPAAPAQHQARPQAGSDSAHAPPQTKPPVQNPGTPGMNRRPLPQPVDLDREAVNAVYRSLTNPETGFMTHGALLFQLVNEFARFQRYQQPLSIARFEMGLSSPDGRSATHLHNGLLREACQRIFGAIRPADCIGHYEHEFVLLLPHTDRNAATQVVEAIDRKVRAAPLAEGLPAAATVLFFGIASMPEDCNHPGILLSAACEAKEQAKHRGQPYMHFADLG